MRYFIEELCDKLGSCFDQVFVINMLEWKYLDLKQTKK
jgi:hypothetical protein